MRESNPCLECGACCAYYRASFYWAEADDATGGGVPVDLTEHLTGSLRVMRGTRTCPPRCVALVGTIGRGVSCSIYDRRPGVCREYPHSWADGERNARCDEARAHHGLAPLEPP